MAKYTVLATDLDHIDASAGVYDESGRPKRVVTHHRGDVVDLSDVPEERLKELVEVGAVAEGEQKLEDPAAPAPAPAPQETATAETAEKPAK